jgi:PAS domain S-box-containing protein
VREHSVIGLIGIIAQFGTAGLLCLVFVLLPRIGTRRRLIWIWAGAFAAKAVATSDFALEAVDGFARLAPQHNVWTATLDFLYWPSTLLFVVLMTVGALEFARRQMSAVALWRTVAGVAIAGALIGMTEARSFGHQLLVIGTPVVLFGSVQFVIAEATGPRKRGLLLLAVAMTIYAVDATAYLLEYLQTGLPVGMVRYVNQFSTSAPYIDALALILVGTAVVVTLVQDSLLEADQERLERIHALASSEDRLKRVISGAGEAIVTVGPSGTIELANPAADMMFAARDGRIAGRRLSDFVDPGGVGVLLADRGGGDGGPSQTTSRTTVGYRGDGTSFPLEVTVAPIAVDGGRGAVAVMRDLTQQRAAEREREEFERRMAEAEKMLAIGRVVSGVAHELNNPLAVVLGQSEQLYDSAPNAEVKFGLRMINEQAQRARHIVKDLLAFARRRDDARESVNLAASARRVVSSQARAAEDHGVALVTNVPERLPPVVADPLAIDQVLVNLVDNALDAAGPDGTVTISGRASNGRTELVVEDSGPGISEQHLGRIFEPFYTTKPTGQGTGLGLSVSTGLIEQQGGTLRVENRPTAGIGARFIVSVPIDPDAMASMPAPRKAVTLPAPAIRHDGTPAEVMLIDDEPAVRATLARIFQRGGWELREAGTGDEALEWLLEVPAERAPGVILCDLKMPGMNGRELYAKLMERRPELATRVIFVTGDVVEQTTASFLASAGREVVEKPFTVAEVALAVQRVMAREPQISKNPA